MSSLVLIRKLKQVASALKTAASWRGSGLAVDAKRDDFVFELYCYFRAAISSSNAFEIRVAGKTLSGKSGGRAAKWPKKPGNKENFSYLVLRDKVSASEVYQLCPGIRIKDKDGKRRAPDFSLLEAGATDHPGHVQVKAIWDAKYSIKPGSTLADTAVSDFIFTYQQFGSPKISARWTSVILEPEWQRSGLISNGGASTELDSTYSNYGVTETVAFLDVPQTRPK